MRAFNHSASLLEGVNTAVADVNTRNPLNKIRVFSLIIMGQISKED